MSESRKTALKPDWLEAAAQTALDNARHCEREAKRLRKLARLIDSPPPGVRFGYGGGGIVNVLTEIKP